MKKTKRVMKKCQNCGKEFAIGWDGIALDANTWGCDTCAGVERDADGNAWLPGKTEITWEDGTITLRSQAFAK